MIEREREEKNCEKEKRKRINQHRLVPIMDEQEDTIPYNCFISSRSVRMNPSIDIRSEECIYLAVEKKYIS